MAHLHNVYDMDGHFVIDPITREIQNTSEKIKVMQGDHNSEHFTFEIKKLVDGHNMSFCNKIEIHYINIDASDKSKKSADFFEAKNVKVSEKDNSVITFLWELSRNATKYAGTLNFMVHFACTDEDGVEEYAWNTEIFQGILVGGGMNNATAEVIEPYIDVIAQWKANLFGVGDTEEQRLLSVSAEQQAAIAAKGAAVLDSIPDEYEALSAMIDQNYMNKAGAIVLGAEGESIVLNDASEYPLQNLKVFGKSTQDGTPTPDSPVDIVSVENPIVTVCKKNYCSSQNYAVIFPCRLKKGVVYTVSVENEVSDAMCLLIYDKNQVRLQSVKCTNDNGERRYAILVPTEDVYYAQWAWANVSTVENGQIEIGSEVTAYEPYNGHTLADNHTIPGIPVSSGGNYTDENGQQWICDEVDFARGVYVQRVYTENCKLAYDEGGDRYTGITTHSANPNCIKGSGIPVLCNILPFHSEAANGTDTNGIRISAAGHSFIAARYNDVVLDEVVLSYPLARPLEIALSDTEINAFKALCSNKPNTTILNDAGAHMAVEYVADTKTYIDNKIAEKLEGVTE